MKLFQEASPSGKALELTPILEFCCGLPEEGQVQIPPVPEFHPAALFEPLFV